MKRRFVLFLFEFQAFVFTHWSSDMSNRNPFSATPAQDAMRLICMLLIEEETLDVCGSISASVF
jgi:hypothetical protein